MRSYTVHRRRRHIGDPEAEADSTRFVREGFAWWALIEPLFWFLYHRTWLVLFGYIATLVAARIIGNALGLGGTGNAIVVAGLHVIAASEANDLRRWTLARKGYDLVAVVLARTLTEAETRYFRAWHAAIVAHREAHGAASDVNVAFRRTSEEPIIGLFPEGGPA